MKSDTEKPEVASGKVPLWIKIMWALGLTWVLVYIYQGLQHSPIDW